VSARLQPGEAAGPGGSITYHVVLGNPTGRAIPLDHCPRYAQERFSIGDATHQAVNEFKLYRLNCRPVRAIPAHGSVRFAMVAEMPSTDRLLPHLAEPRPVMRFDFLGWGRSDKPQGYPYTARNQAGDLAAVAGALDEHIGAGELVLVAHDASGPPAIDWALANPERVVTLVLLNTYFHWTAGLRRPPRIALYPTPIIRAAARAIVRRPVRDQLVPQLYEQSLPARRRSGASTTTCSPRWPPAGGASAICAASAGPSAVIFGARDRYLNPRVARNFAALFPNSELHLLDGAGHYVQVDQPERVADLILDK
jgi:haloalkane dehalogenase